MVHTTVDSTLCQTNWTHESFSRTESGNRTRACLKTPEGRIIGSKLELGLIGDAKETLSELLPLLKHKKNDKHLKACLEKERPEFHGRALLLGPWIRSVHSGLELEQVREIHPRTSELHIASAGLVNKSRPL